MVPSICSCKPELPADVLLLPRLGVECAPRRSPSIQQLKSLNCPARLELELFVSSRARLGPFHFRFELLKFVLARGTGFDGKVEFNSRLAFEL
ncbi:hypothetical protein B0H12DRAFT_1119845 [Mycena haematopus]|nr:hypothetical protein B0H12DRAFT_1119807 [Mycena haematopus]KAJ7251159.1 hypothetical protein B0H12DRAFT_1119845 [Mycena haematopus]